MLGKMFHESRDYATLLIRVALGWVFIYHGAQKVFGVWGGGGLSGFADTLRSNGWPIPMVFAIMAGIGELMGGLLVTAGIITRYAALILAVIMFVAAVTFHHHAFGMKYRGFEYNFVLGMMALSLVIAGGGKGSVDRLLGHDERV